LLHVRERCLSCPTLCTASRSLPLLCRHRLIVKSIASSSPLLFAFCSLTLRESTTTAASTEDSAHHVQRQARPDEGATALLAIVQRDGECCGLICRLFAPIPPPPGRKGPSTRIRAVRPGSALVASPAAVPAGAAARLPSSAVRWCRTAAAAAWGL
jgi:hypothetical protein